MRPARVNGALRRSRRPLWLPAVSPATGDSADSRSILAISSGNACRIGCRLTPSPSASSCWPIALPARNAPLSIAPDSLDDGLGEHGREYGLFDPIIRIGRRRSIPTHIGPEQALASGVPPKSPEPLKVAVNKRNKLSAARRRAGLCAALSGRRRVAAARLHSMFNFCASPRPCRICNPFPRDPLAVAIGARICVQVSIAIDQVLLGFVCSTLSLQCFAECAT